MFASKSQADLMSTTNASLGEHSIPLSDSERMQRESRRVAAGILAVVGLFVSMWFGGLIPHAHGHSETHVDHGTPYLPPLVWIAPFAVLLLAIAVLPLISATEHWWHHNKNRFLVASVLGTVTLGFYAFVHPGGIANHFTHAHNTAPGFETAFAAFSNAIFAEYVPFIVLLFSLYVISGGINLSGDLRAHPWTNAGFLGIGGLAASFIGTTGAAMVLIRPLLSTNAERKHTVHTVVFFIFIVCNCGGLLLPIGDPPLFLGYLRGVPFGWTLSLWPYWLLVNIAILAIYLVCDYKAYSREDAKDIRLDESEIRPLRLRGTVNFLFLLGVVLCVAFVVPDKPFLGTGWAPPMFFREALMLLLVVCSLRMTRPETRLLNRFDYAAIIEVAALFCGIFLCMQVPVEILNLQGAKMGIDNPVKFFWATGALSSFLDNAPTYVVFFETARTLTTDTSEGLVTLASGPHVLEGHLMAISLGAVFMGAMTYIGNGPNFMVKSIAEQSGVKMPSFFGYMLYSCAILLPLWGVVTLLLMWT